MGLGDKTAALYVVPGSFDPTTGAWSTTGNGADLTSSGTLTVQNTTPTGAAPAGSVVTAVTNGKSTTTVQISANTLNVPLSLYGTVDGVNWVLIGGLPLLNQATAYLSNTILAGATGIWTFSSADFSQVRVSTPNAATTGSATVSLISGSQPAIVAIDNTVLIARAQPADSWASTQGITVNTDVIGKAAPAAGLRNYVTDIVASNTSATATVVSIKDGATAIWQFSVAAGATVVITFAVPLRCTAATGTNINVLLATTTMYVNLSGFVGA